MLSDAAIEMVEEEGHSFVPMARKVELWEGVEKKLRPRLQPEEKEEYMSILKGIFFRRLKEDKGEGGALQFARFVAPEAYRLFKRGDGTRHNTIIAECPECGKPLKALNNWGYECQNSACFLMGAAIGTEMLRGGQVLSLDAICDDDCSPGMAAMANDIALETSATTDETKIMLNGVLMDERLAQILGSEKLTSEQKTMVARLVSDEYSSMAELGQSFGISERTIKRRFRDMQGLMRKAQKRAA